MNRRKALIVGINYYDNGQSLQGSVNDAYNVKEVISKNSDGTKNFDTRLLTAVDENSKITRSELKQLVRELFKDDNDVSLFYFSGHGFLDSTGGYLVTSDFKTGDDGLSLSELIGIVNTSKVRNKIIILDTCHSGFMGDLSTETQISEIGEGVTILTASQKHEFAMEVNYEGVFTKLFVDALNGSASNLMGEVSPGSVYAHIDQSLSSWDQRPVFKTNVKNFISLRKTQPPISILDLKKITELFDEDFVHQLDPSYEPSSDEPVKENTEKFSVLQKYNRLNLVKPVGTDHMYYAAMETKSCKLTVVGEFYWRLVKNGRI